MDHPLLRIRSSRPLTAPRRLHAAILVAAALVPLPCLAQPSAEAIVWRGGDVGSIGSIASLNPPAVLTSGEVVFNVFLTGATIDSSNDYALLAGRYSVDLLCQEGDAFTAAGAGVTLLCPSMGAVGVASSTPGRRVRVVGPSWLSGVGLTTADDTAEVSLGGWFGSGSLVAREGETAPDTALLFDQLGYTTRINPAQIVAFQAVLRSGTGPPVATGIWAGSPEAVSLFVRDGDLVTGLNGALSVLSGLVLSPSGTVALHASTTTGDEGIVLGPTNGAPAALVATGALDPGGGGTFQSFSGPAINRWGQVAFKGILGTGAEGIWVGGLGGLRRVALEGEAAPDTGDFTAVSGPSIGGNGDVCFYAPTSSAGEGLFCEIDGALEVVAREGSSHPALDPGETMGDLFAGPIVNFHSQVLFFSFVPRLAGGAVDIAWWMRDTSGGVHLIAREGGLLQVAGQGLKEIATLDSPYGAGVDDGGATSFNDAGQVTFRASFADGTQGIFLSQPEPALPPEIFAGTFESGDISQWSTASPP